MFQGVDDASDAAVDLLDHGAVDGHADIFVLLVLHVGPWRCVLITCGDRPFLVDNAEGFLLFVTGAADLVPPAHVFAFVPGDIIFPRVQRPVRRSEGDVLEEWFAIGHGVVDLGNGVIGDSVSEVEIRGFHVYQSVLEEQSFRIPERVGRLDETEVFVEAALCWKRVRFIARHPLVAEPPIVSASNVPLAGHERSISGRFDDFGDGYAVVVQVTLICGHTQISGHLSDTCLVGVETRKKGGTRRAAASTVVHLREADAVVA